MLNNSVLCVVKTICAPFGFVFLFWNFAMIKFTKEGCSSFSISSTSKITVLFHCAMILFTFWFAQKIHKKIAYRLCEPIRSSGADNWNRTNLQQICSLSYDHPSLSAYGRGDATWTHNTQFWRLPLYQLSYTPMVLQTGIEPVRHLWHRILSPLRLPIPPLKHNIMAVLRSAVTMAC